MSLSQAWPGASGAAQVSDVRNDVEAIVMRAGVMPFTSNTRPGATLVNRPGSMTPSITEFYAAIQRTPADGTQFIYNDGPGGVVPAFETAPSAGSRLDLLWVKVFDPKYDAKTGVEFGISKGDATTSGSPIARRGDMPAGALELGTMLIPAGATTLQSSGVTWTDTYQFGALRGGVLYYRSSSAMTSSDAALYPLGTDGMVVGTSRLMYVTTSGWSFGQDDILKATNVPNKPGNSIAVPADARMYTKVFYTVDSTNSAGYITVTIPDGGFPNECDGVWATTYFGHPTNPVVNDANMGKSTIQLYFGSPSKVVGVLVMAVGH
jgi:hypothetical protein